MAIDWSKYGVDSSDEEKQKSKTGINWDNYTSEGLGKKTTQRTAAIKDNFPDLLDPMKQQEEVKKTFSKPSETKKPTKQTVKSEPNPLGVYQKPTAFTQKANPTFDELMADPSYANDLRSPADKWVESRLESDAKQMSGNRVTRAINKALAPASEIVYGATAKIPGIAAFQQGAAEGAGTTSFAPPSGNGLIDKIAGFAGNVAGSAAAAQTGGGNLYGTADKLGRTAANALPKASPLAKRAAEFGIAGAAAGATDSLLRGNTDAKDVATNAALGGGLGIAGGVLAGGIGALVRRMRSNNVPEEAVQELLALPAPRERGRANTAVTEGVINNADTTTRPQPLGLPAPEMLPPTTGRIAQQSNPYRQQYEQLASTVQDLQSQGKLTPGREMEEIESIWSQIAGREGVSLDELINRAYPSKQSKLSPDLVNRARTNQASREVAGAPLPVRSTSDRLVNRQGVTGQVQAPVERVGRDIRLSRQSKAPTVENKPAAPTRPRIEVEAEEVVNAAKEPRVRDRVYKALDDAEKAARERIAKRRNVGILPQGGNDIVDYSIIGAAKLGKGTVKLADWTEDMVKEFGEDFRPKAKQVYNASKERLRTEERKASKEGQDAATFNNSGRGNADSFDSKISRSKAKKSTPFSKKIDNIRSQFEDDLIHFDRLEKNVTGRVANAEDSLYKSARLFKGTPERAAQIVTDRLSPIVKTVEDAGYTADDLGRYALAKHAQDVNNAGYKSGFTNAEIQDVLKKYGTPEMEKAQQDLVKVNRDLMDELVDSGVVSQDLADILNERWKNYIPLFRSFDDEKVEFSKGLSNALANVSNPIKALKGSERAVVDPLENMVKNIMQSVNSSERNKVASQLSKLAMKDKDGQFIKKLSPDEKVGRKNVVTVRENGEPIRYEVEPEVYKAFLNLDQESSNMLMNVLAKPASLLRAGATLTPEFSLRNPMRDILSAYVTSNSGFNPITDFGAGLIQSIKKGPLYKEWVDNLGSYGNVMSQDRDVHRKALEKVLKQPASKKFVNVVTGKSLINLLRSIADTTESATKIGEYRAARRQGQSRQEAAYRSRDIMDFGRAGSSIRQANKIVAFLNANIQGKSKLLRAIKNNPVGTTARMFSAVTVPTVAIYAWNEKGANATQKQTISESPDWLKDAFWLVAVPGTDQVARIPKPFDIAPLFANLPEKALDFVRVRDKQAFDGFVQRTLKESGLPSQISGILPLIEGMADYSFFREGSIIPQREQSRAYQDQYDPIRTTETAKLLAKGAQALTGGQGAFKNFSSPRVMDNTIKGFTAGLGTYATSAVDALLKGMKVVDRPEAPEKRLAQQPLLKSFLVDPLQGGKSMDKFYTELEKLQTEKSHADINDNPFKNSSRLNQLNKASDSMSKINKRIREIESSDKTAKEKRDLIETLTQQRNTLAQNAVKAGG